MRYYMTIWKTGLNYKEQKMIYLTQQQDKVLKSFLRGLNMKELALEQSVSYSRIINILNEILLKSGIKSRKELLINGHKLDYMVK